MESARDPACAGLGSDLDAALAEASWLRRLARSLVRDPHRAEEAVQETWLAALEHGAPAAPRGWLATVLRNRLRQDARASERRVRHEQSAPEARPAASPDELNARLELQGILLEAVRGLEEPYRAAIVARFFDELPPRAIAKREGVPVKTVNTWLERGLAKLRARLDGRFGGERRSWMSALLPWAGAGWREGLIGALQMGVKTKAAVGCAAVLVALWLGRALLTEPRNPEGARAQDQHGFARGPDASTTDPRVDLSSSDAREAPGLATPAPNETRSAPEPKEPPIVAARSHATLAVRVEKSRTGEALRQGTLSVTEASSASETGAELLEGEIRVLAQANLDASGRTQLRVPAAEALWVAVDPGNWEEIGDLVEPLQRTRVRVEPLAPGEERALVLAIEHGNDRVFEGQVVAAEDGRPLTEARIARLDGYPGEPLGSDGQGFFAMPYASWDPPPFVEVAQEGFTAVRLRPQWLDQTPGVPNVVALEREAFVVARVTGGGGRELELRATDAELGLLRVRLDERGNGELGVPARHPLALELRGADDTALWGAPEPWRLEPGERRELALTLGAGSLVFGTLRDPAGNALADQELWAVAAKPGESIEGETRLLHDDLANPASAHTDALGRFEFAALHDGPWWIGPPPSDDRSVPPGDTNALANLFLGVELRPGETTRRVDLIGHPGLWIAGRAESEDGRAVPWAFVRCTPPQGHDDFEVVADSEGHFWIGPLAPGAYELRAIGGDGVFGWPRDSQTVEAGRRDVVVVVELKNSIGGRVVDREGRAQDAQAHLLQRNGSLGQGTSNSQQGAFRFIGLEPGVYSVQAEAPDGRVAVQSVSLEDGKYVSGVVLTLDEGARIGVSHALTRNVRCAIFADGVLAADSTVRVGEENFETVPAGRLRVELYSGNDVIAVRELVGRAGRVETVRFGE